MASFALVIGIWELAAQMGWIDLFFFSSPSRVIAAGFREVQLPRFWNDVGTSGQEFLTGYVLALALGVPFGLVTGWFRDLNYFFEPWLSAFNSMPRIALLPLVVLWAGLGFASKVVIIFLGAFFPVAINTFLGVRTVDRNFVEVARTFGASRWKFMATIVFPSVLPFILVGMRIAVGRSVAGVVVGEFYQSNAGLGNMIFKAGQTLQTDRLLFGALFMTVLALLFFQMVATLEARVRAWRPRVGSG